MQDAVAPCSATSTLYHSDYLVWCVAHHIERNTAYDDDYDALRRSTLSHKGYRGVLRYRVSPCNTP